MNTLKQKKIISSQKVGKVEGRQFVSLPKGIGMSRTSASLPLLFFLICWVGLCYNTGLFIRESLISSLIIVGLHALHVDQKNQEYTKRNN